MDILYHYCTVQTLIAILNSKKVWLSDAYKMNDSHEIIWAEKLIDQLLLKRKSSMSDQDREQFILGYRNNRLHPFIFCLSSEPDILSQWRAYGGDGAGVSIGFNVAIFPRQNHLPHTNAVPKMNTGLWEVIYLEQEQELNVAKVFDMAIQSPDICVGVGGAPEYQLLGAYMASISPLLKNPAFQEEKEFRLIHTPKIMTDINNKHSTLGTDYLIGQRVANNRIITHFEFPLPYPAHGSIKEIWLGPKSLLNEQDIKLAFAINDLGEVSVKRSLATYR
jgi:hypothetical protein